MFLLQQLPASQCGGKVANKAEALHSNQLSHYSSQHFCECWSHFYKRVAGIKFSFWALNEILKITGVCALFMKINPACQISRGYLHIRLRDKPQKHSQLSTSSPVSTFFCYTDYIISVSVLLATNAFRHSSLLWTGLPSINSVVYLMILYCTLVFMWPKPEAS